MNLLDYWFVLNVVGFWCSIMSFATISVGFVATSIFVAVCYMGLSWGASKSTALWFPQTEGAPKSSRFFLCFFFMKYTIHFVVPAQLTVITSLFHVLKPTSCQRLCRAPGCSVVSLMMFRAGVGWDVNVGVHVALMMLRWWCFVDDGTFMIYLVGNVLCEIWCSHAEALKSVYLRMIWLEQTVWQRMWRRTNMRGNNSQKLAAMSNLFHG